jgi:hypothetical protein
MHGNRKSLAALGVAALCCGIALSTYRPAGARPQVMAITGSYFGTFRASNGDLFQTDLNITNQSGRRFGGSLNAGAIFSDAVFTGLITPSGSITFTGIAGRRPSMQRLKLRGRHRAGADGGNDVIEGTFVATGTRKLRGTFTVVGHIDRDGN